MPSGGSAGGGLDEYRWIKCDIHGALNEAEHQPDLKAWKPGAIAFMKAVLAKKGWGLMLSCGGFRDDGGGKDRAFKEKVDAALLRQGIDRKNSRIIYSPDDRYILTINDRGVDFENNWPELQTLALKMIAEAERTGSPDVATTFSG